MDLPEEIDDYLRESIEYSLGLPVSTHTLKSKLRLSEEAQAHLRDQCFYLKLKLMEKDKAIQGARAESGINAQAVKKFVEENQKLAMECSDLLARCAKWETECSLYDRDLEALMDFGNEADERAKVAESRVRHLEEELSKLSEEMQSLKQQLDSEIGTLKDNESTENILIATLLSSLINKEEVSSIAQSFLEANSGVDVGRKMLIMWDRLKPSTWYALALASKVKKLQKDKDRLQINLVKAEEEVSVLFDENNLLDKENMRLSKLLEKERNLLDSGEKHSNGSIKNSKRKSSPCPKQSIPNVKKSDFSDTAGSPR